MKFRVKISKLQCSDLPTKDPHGVYVKLNFDCYKKFRTKTIDLDFDMNNNPRWDTEWEFTYETKYGLKLYKKLFVLKVCLPGKGLAAADVELGRASLDLHTLATGSTRHDLPLLRYNDNKPTDTHARIRFCCEFEQVAAVSVVIQSVALYDLPVLGQSSYLQYYYSGREGKVQRSERSLEPVNPVWTNLSALKFTASLKEVWSENLIVDVFVKGKSRLSSMKLGTISLPIKKFHSYIELKQITVEQPLSMTPDFQSLSCSVRIQFCFTNFPIYGQMIGGVHTGNGEMNGGKMFDRYCMQLGKKELPEASGEELQTLFVIEKIDGAALKKSCLETPATTASHTSSSNRSTVTVDKSDDSENADQHAKIVVEQSVSGKLSNESANMTSSTYALTSEQLQASRSAMYNSAAAELEYKHAHADSTNNRPLSIATGNSRSVSSFQHEYGDPNQPTPSHAVYSSSPSHSSTIASSRSRTPSMQHTLTHSRNQSTNSLQRLNGSSSYNQLPTTSNTISNLPLRSSVTQQFPLHLRPNQSSSALHSTASSRQQSRPLSRETSREHSPLSNARSINNTVANNTRPDQLNDSQRQFSVSSTRTQSTAGIAGFCCECQRSADFVCSQTKQPVCSQQCKTNNLRKPAAAAHHNHSVNTNTTRSIDSSTRAAGISQTISVQSQNSSHTLPRSGSSPTLSPDQHNSSPPSTDETISKPQHSQQYNKSKPGVVGFCCVCDAPADFVCSVSAVPVCSQQCKVKHLQLNIPHTESKQQQQLQQTIAASPSTHSDSIHSEDDDLDHDSNAIHFHEDPAQTQQPETQHSQTLESAT